MYTLSQTKDHSLDFLVLKSPDGASQARISINQGGRLDRLILNTIETVESVNALKYKINYASAILFPFANRVKNGAYLFNNKNHQLHCNEEDKNNALHGLVYNKTFKLTNSNLEPDSGSITLRFDDEGQSPGFPFKYSLELTYRLSANTINLLVNILNTDKNTFPFTLGWHPYFKTKDLYSSFLNFKSSTEYVVDNKLIPIGKIDFNKSMPFQLKDRLLDTGYKLEKNNVILIAPNYQLKIESTAKENYLQLYIPMNSNSIAIEPMTGAADSFNNKIGLQTLKPNTNHKVQWTITIIKPTPNITN